VPRTGTTNAFPELGVKQRLQQAVEKDEEQNGSKVTPFRILNNRQGGIVFPASLCYSDSGGLYISDNNGHKIEYWPSDSSTAKALPTEAPKGELKFPNTVQWSSDGRILVADNDGIKVFSPEGQFEGLTRSYLGISSFAITDKRTILANTLIRNPADDDPLIVEIEQGGKQVRGFGARRNVAGHNGAEDVAFLTLSKTLLFAAFKYHPTVEIYDIDSGKLVQTLAIDHPVFRALPNELKSEGLSEGQQHGRVFIPRYLAGIRILDNRLFLCLHLPEPEIWELDQKGNRLAEFRISGLPPAVDFFGFDVRRDQGNLLFAVGIIDQGWNATVSEIRITSELAKRSTL
jgi:WD40 repeat protein